MTDDPTLPSRIPPPPHAKLAGPRTPTTRVPRVFNIWGTICYSVSAVSSLIAILLMGIFKWTPPWYFLLPAFLYVFISSGIIALGRIQANKDARFFIRMLKRRSDENKQREMRRMN